MILNSDREFYEKLVVHAKIAQGTENPILPLFFRADKSLDRDKILAGPAFVGFNR